jgi:3-isopropylmalate/(R)-2-methylmalate dehydratase small subunit
MQSFGQLEGIAVPMRTANIDTDQLLPARFLRKAREAGLARYLFHDWRFDEHEATRSQFILNNPIWHGASILVTLRNFGCGSSREYAVYALQDYGFRVVIAPSFGGILYNNSLKNGLLPIVFDEDEVETLITVLEDNPGARLTIDLEKQKVGWPDGSSHLFHIESYNKNCLLQGLDDFDLAISEFERIKAFEVKHAEEMPWV